MPSISRIVKAHGLEKRVEKKWWKVSEFAQKIGIPSSAPTRLYRQFISSFPITKIGRFSLNFSQVQGESLVALTIRTINKRRYVGVKDRKFKIPPIPVPCQPFKARFILASTIEPQIKHPFKKEKGVCVITSLIGPGEKYGENMRMVDSLKQEVGGPWQNYLVRQLVEHSKAQGLGAVALLRPEHNHFLSNEYLAKAGVSSGEAEQMRSAFYAAARKNKMKKVKGSKYFWIYF